MIPAETEQLWTDYLSSENRCTRLESLDVLNRFIGSILVLSPEIWQMWARDLCKKIVDDGSAIPLRMPLFQRVVFPALLADLHNLYSRSALYLASFAQQLYKSQSCMEQLPIEMRSELGLLLEAMRLAPNDKSVIERLLNVMRRRFDYTLHELPIGVLYGIDFATIEECDLMLTELDKYQGLVKQLGEGEEHYEGQKIIQELRFHIPAYKQYLSELAVHQNYETFLVSQVLTDHNREDRDR